MIGKLLFIAMAVVLICFLKYWTRKRRQERGLPIFSVKSAWQPVLKQPILKSTAVFGFRKGEQDRLLLEKYYRGRWVTVEKHKYRIDLLKKLPAYNFKNSCYYRIYFQECYGEEFPRKFMIYGHIRYWKCVFGRKGVTFYEHVEHKKVIAYKKVIVLIGRHKMSLASVETRKILTVFYDYNFTPEEFALMKEILIKYAQVGLIKRGQVRRCIS